MSAVASGSRPATFVRAGRIFVLAAAMLLTGSARAADPPAESESPLARLAWMSGSWSATRNGVSSEEYWTGPEGGLMLGMNRARRGGRAVMFEFLRIVARGDTITYLAMPRGRNETPFPLKEMSERRVVFENLEHDFPQRIVYWQEAPDELRARTEGTIRGKLESEEWVWKRAKRAP